jgi:hypothetical protein
MLSATAALAASCDNGVQLFAVLCRTIILPRFSFHVCALFPSIVSRPKAEHIRALGISAFCFAFALIEYL